MLREAPSGYASVRGSGAAIGLNRMEALAEGHPIKPHAGERLGLGVEFVLMVDDVQAAHDRASERAGWTCLR